MEIDMSYIFGSFARRRQSSHASSVEVSTSFSNKRKSLENNLKISHDRSKSTPHTPVKKSTPSSPRAKSVIYNVTFDEGRFTCPMCRRHFVEPRVLPCLHTFCLRCLQELEGCSFATWEESDDSVATLGSGGSGYTSDHNKGSCSPSSSSSRRIIWCPTCGSKTEVPVGGVAAYHPNYLVQNRIVLATLNAQNTHLLCDLCTSNVTAVSRCMECAISFCYHCEEVHLRQKSSANHQVLTLEEARKRGITRVRRQIMCVQHPEFELSLFCSSCYQVVCEECAVIVHKSHQCDPVTKAIKSHLSSLRLASEKAKSVAEQSVLSANRLHSISKKIESQCGKIQSDVERFIDNYVQSLENHRRVLLEQIEKTKSERLEEIGRFKTSLHKKVKDARDVAFFLEELLSEGSEVEVMSFLKPVLNKIETCTNLDKVQKDFDLGDSLQFLPEESVQYSEHSSPLYGVLTTQNVSAAHCVLETEGLANLRVGKKTEIILETRDKHEKKLERGGEQIVAEIRYRDAGISRFLLVDVEDRRDGTYAVTFTPDVAGKLVLSVNVKGAPIKDSPFPITVRTLKPHHGTFHCCSFCSSGGSKEASCGCGGRMPGGYKGCGHGHEGHPGRRHWSCCGNVLEHSECTKPNHSHSHYQFTL